MKHYATESDLRTIMEAWWHYLGRKTEVHPHITLNLAGGISPRLVYDNEELKCSRQGITRTVKFSLVPYVAPELKGIGNLVGAKKPHVYVEGVRDRITKVSFHELYAQKRPRLTGPFLTDPKNTFPQYMGSHEKEPEYFLLHINATNDLDVYGRVLENITAEDVIFFATKDDKTSGYTIKGGWYAFHPNPLRHAYSVHPALRDAFSFSYEKKPDIDAITINDAEVIYKSLKDAEQRIS